MGDGPAQGGRDFSQHIDIRPSLSTRRVWPCMIASPFIDNLRIGIQLADVFAFNTASGNPRRQLLYRDPRRPHDLCHDGIYHRRQREYFQPPFINSRIHADLLTSALGRHTVRDWRHLQM